MFPIGKLFSLTLAVTITTTTAYGQAAPSPQPPKVESASDATKTPGPAPLVVYFDSGSSKLRPKDKATLDQASRAYNEGKPIVMIITGTSDAAGSPQRNLQLSQKRATAILNGLLDRGIPADRFQIVAKGVTDLAVPTASGVSEARNRRVEITWH